MEHRWNVRMPIRAAVALGYPGLGQDIARGQTRDLSIQGAYVEVDSISIAEHSLVHVRFAAQNTAEQQDFLMPAFVTRSDTEGLGLMFIDTETEASGRLIKFLRRQLDALLDQEMRDFTASDTETGEHP